MPQDLERFLQETKRGKQLVENLKKSNPNMTFQQILRYASKFWRMFMENTDREDRDTSYRSKRNTSSSRYGTSALRNPPLRPGRDEPDNSNIDNLKMFVDDLEFEGQTQPKKKQSVQDFRRQLKWLYDMIDEGQRTRRFRTTGNRFQSGRFYSFNYVPRHRTQLPIWDARPIILCLDPQYATHYFNIHSSKPNIGVLGINWHYVPMRDRRRMLKQLIYQHSGNRQNFIDNRAIDTQAIESLSGVYNGVQKHGALRQYLRGGKYKNKSGDLVNAGAFNIIQLPYNHITEILEVPSIYDAGFVGGRPPGV